MPLLDIQQRFRELGRIRTGVKVPTGKTVQKGPRKGEPVMRPSKLARFRLTSPWQHLIGEVADQFGGEVKPWENEGRAEFECIVEVDRLPVLVPPGSVFTQWYELWSGGGCMKRCDGRRQVLQDRPCSCPADPEERQALAANGEACKPTSRLNVMIPAIADLGVWRLESHGFYAASELAPAAGLCELATRQGAMIPADLVLVEREGARRPGQVRKKFFVPAISFRGALGPVLEALGVDPNAPAVLLGVEPRPALNAGGTPELPAARTPFDPQSPVEAASVPTGQPELPDEPFTPPLSGSSEQDDEGSVLSRAQSIAMRCNEAGIDRHHLISAVTGGRVSSGKEVTPEEASALFLALVKLRRGQVVLVERDGRWLLEEAGERVAVKPDEVIAPPPPAPVEDSRGAPPEPGSNGSDTTAPAVGTAEGAPREPDGDEFSMVGDEAGWPDDKWRRFLAARKVKIVQVMREANRLALELGEKPPGTLADLHGRKSLCSLLRGWVEDESGEPNR